MTIKQYAFCIASNKLSNNITFLDYGYSSVDMLFAL